VGDRLHPASPDLTPEDHRARTSVSVPALVSDDARPGDDGDEFDEFAAAAAHGAWIARFGVPPDVTLVNASLRVTPAAFYQTSTLESPIT